MPVRLEPSTPRVLSQALYHRATVLPPHADVTRGAGGLIFRLTLPLFPYFVYARRDGFAWLSIWLGSSEPLLLASLISIKILCVCACVRDFREKYLHFHFSFLRWNLAFQMFAYFYAKQWTITWSDKRLGWTNINVSQWLALLLILCDVIIISPWPNQRIVMMLCARVCWMAVPSPPLTIKQIISKE